VFKVFDKDSDGLVTAGDLQLFFRELGEELPEESIQQMIEEHDEDQDGCLTFEEFAKIMLHS